MLPHVITFLLPQPHLGERNGSSIAMTFLATDLQNELCLSLGPNTEMFKVLTTHEQNTIKKKQALLVIKTSTFHGFNEASLKLYPHWVRWRKTLYVKASLPPMCMCVWSVTVMAFKIDLCYKITGYVFFLTYGINTYTKALMYYLPYTL